MADRMINAVIPGKKTERAREEEHHQGGQRYRYERLAAEESNSIHIDNTVEESHPEPGLEIERDAPRRKYPILIAHLRNYKKDPRLRVIAMAFGIVGVALFLYWAVM